MKKSLTDIINQKVNACKSWSVVGIVNQKKENGRSLQIGALWWALMKKI